MDIENLPILQGSPSAILVTTHTWGGLQYFAHHLSRYLDNKGLQVSFIEKSPQRWPQNVPRDFWRWLGVGKRTHSQKSLQETQVNIVSPHWLPPGKWLRPVNRRLIARDVKKNKSLKKADLSPIVICFPPTYNTIDFIELIRPSAVAYINNFNYDADNIIMKDLLKSENEILSYCDALFGLSDFCANRLKMMAPKRTIFTCLPGVDYKSFHMAFRGNESIECKSVCYFGGIGPHLDLPIYDALADSGIHVIMEGEVDPLLRGKLNSKFEIRPPCAHDQLPIVLRDADCLIIAYKNTEYMKGVFPAKFFECLATGKPLLVSGLPELMPYYDVIYDVEGSGEKAIDVIKQLPTTETSERLRKRDGIAQAADWTRRFEKFFHDFNEGLIKREGNA